MLTHILHAAKRCWPGGTEADFEQAASDQGRGNGADALVAASTLPEMERDCGTATKYSNRSRGRRTSADACGHEI